MPAAYAPPPAAVAPAEATAAGAPRVWDQCPDNIGFVQLFGDKAATDAAFANAAHVVKHRFVINRVTAASMEPRGSMLRSEEHTSELQSLRHLVCRLLLEKKKQQHKD